MDAIKIDAFPKEVLDNEGIPIEVGVLCIQVAKTTTIVDYVRSKEMLERLFDVKIIEETVRELSSISDKSRKEIQLIVLHLRRNKAT